MGDNAALQQLSDKYYKNSVEERLYKEKEDRDTTGSLFATNATKLVKIGKQATLYTYEKLTAPKSTVRISRSGDLCIGLTVCMRLRVGELCEQDFEYSNFKNAKPDEEDQMDWEVCDGLEVLQIDDMDEYLKSRRIRTEDLVKEASYAVGGNLTEKVYGEQMEFCERAFGVVDATKDSPVRLHYTNMETLRHQLVHGNSFDDKGERVLEVEVPLRFSFSESLDRAMPLIALQYYDVRLSLELGNFARNRLLSMRLRTRFVLLDSPERTMMARNQHSFIHRIHSVKRIVSPISGQSTRLDFCHPASFLYFRIMDAQGRPVHKFRSAQLDIYGKMAIKGNAMELGYGIPSECGMTPVPGWFVMMFATAPCIDLKDVVSSGTLNMSEDNNASLTMTWFTDQDERGFTIDMFADTYNSQKIMGGMGALEFAN